MIAYADPNVPRIQDWCTFCQAYTEQINGRTANRTAATQCRGCCALLLYP